eukprot:gene11314-3382_t
MNAQNFMQTISCSHRPMYWHLENNGMAYADTHDMARVLKPISTYLHPMKVGIWPEKCQYMGLCEQDIVCMNFCAFIYASVFLALMDFCTGEVGDDNWASGPFVSSIICFSFKRLIL